MTTRSSRREFLERAVQAIAVTAVGGGVVEASQKKIHQKYSIVAFVFDGGMSQAESFDAKPDAMDEYQSGIGYIRTNNGAIFSEVFPKLASLSGKLSIIRTLRAGGGDHTFDTERFLQNPERKNFLAEYGAAHTDGGFPYVYTAANIPGYGDGLSGFSNAVRKFNDPPHEVRNAFVARDRGDFYQAPYLRAHPRLQKRVALRAALDNADFPSTTVDSYEKNSRIAIDLLLGKPTAAFNPPPKNQLERYGDNAFGRSAYLAGQLVKEGVGAVTIRTGHWDFHENIKRMMSMHAPRQDQAIGALIEDMETGDIPPAVVFGMGEFGRSAIIDNVKNGREHWPEAFSGFFYGGSFSRGAVIGKTDKNWVPKTESIKTQLVPSMVLRAAGQAISLDEKRKMPDALFR